MIYETISVVHPLASGLGLDLGTMISAGTAMLVAVVGGVGAYFRYRKAAREIEDRANNNSNDAIGEASEKLEEQYEARISQYEKTIELQDQANHDQQRMYEERLNTLKSFNATLLSQILKRPK